MSRRMEEILLRKELLRGRCALDRLEVMSAWMALRGIRPLNEAARVLQAPRVKGRLIEIVIIAIGSTRLRRAARWLARGVLAWRAWSLIQALRGARTAMRGVPPAAAASPVPNPAPKTVG